MAARSSGKQGVGVYLVCPLSRASFAASLINTGVSKSGSPAPNPTTSIPAFFIAPGLALTARVIDSDTSFIRSASGNIRIPPRIQYKTRRGTVSSPVADFKSRRKAGDGIAGPLFGWVMLQSRFETSVFQRPKRAHVSDV